MPNGPASVADAYRETADTALVEQSVAGDQAAFAELVRRYRTQVFRLAASILGQGFAHEAEDVAQDVMLRVYHALKTFRGDSSFGSWVYRIAYNHALNFKARMRYTAPHAGDDALAVLPAGGRGPEADVQAAERRRAVMACTAELPDVYQSALRLHYWLGASMAEIAELLDVSENTVKSYLHRARGLLRSMLAERGFHE